MGTPRRLDLGPADLFPEAEAWVGRLLDGRSVPVRHRLSGGEPTTVYRPDGSLLAYYWPGAIPEETWRRAEPAWVAASRQETRNRGVAFGAPRRPYVREDGTRSRTTQIDYHRFPDVRAIGSGIVGAFDRSVRYPYARFTEFTLKHPWLIRDMLPYLQCVAARFAEAVPDRYAVQMAFARASAPEWIFDGTPFSTCTVNRDFPTAVHRDAGDLPEGFGVLSVLRSGTYSGCETVLPRWGVSADMRSGDVLFYDIHEPHGNAPLAGRPGRYRRVAVVSYLRQMIPACGRLAEEKERAQTRERGRPLYSAEELARLDRLREATRDLV